MEGKRAGVSSYSLAADTGLWWGVCMFSPSSLQRHSLMEAAISGSGKTHFRAGLITTIACFHDFTVGFLNTLYNVIDILVINVFN